jgi:hypothetical protein
MGTNKRADFLGIPSVKIDSGGSSAHTHPNLTTLNGINSSGSGDIITAIERSELHTHDNKTTIDSITAIDLANYDTAYNNTHIHANLLVLEGITNYGSGKIITDTERTHYDTAYTNNHTHINKTVLDGITSKGSGDIITTLERSNLHTHPNKTVIDGLTDSGSGAVITTTERNNLHVHANKEILNNITNSGSGAVITVDERTRLNRINHIRTITGSDVLTIYDDIVFCSSSSAITVSLLTAVGYNGRLEINNVGDGIATIDPYSTQTINNSETFDLYPNESVVIVSNTTDWRII